MIKVYNNGESFINDNDSFLSENKYMTSLFYVDGKLLNDVDKKNFAVKAFNESKVLLGIKVEPYNLLLYGDMECLSELLVYLADNEYEFNGIMCNMTLGDELIRITNSKYNLSIGMDFMEAKTYTEDSSCLVLVPTSDDLEDIYSMSIDFFRDCGLPDVPSKDKILNMISSFRIIKENNEAIAMAAYTKDLEDSFRITHVYTKPSKRGKGYAKMIVNHIKNEILDMDKIATLNVDINNPISNHIYQSLGFKRLFSQGIYLKV